MASEVVPGLIDTRVLPIEISVAMDIEAAGQKDQDLINRVTLAVSLTFGTRILIIIQETNTCTDPLCNIWIIFYMWYCLLTSLHVLILLYDAYCLCCGF